MSLLIHLWWFFLIKFKLLHNKNKYATHLHTTNVTLLLFKNSFQ